MITPLAWRIRVVFVCLSVILSACLNPTTPPPIHDTSVSDKDYNDCASYTVAFTAEMHVLASGGYAEICLWDLQTGRLIRLFKVESMEASPKSSLDVVSIMFSPDDKVLAVGIRDGTLRLFDPETGAQLHVLRGHEAGIRSVRYSPDGRYLASGGHDAMVRLWNAATGEPIRVLEGHHGMIEAIRFSADGRLIASGAFDGTARIWETETGKQVKVCDVLMGEASRQNFMNNPVSVRIAGFRPDGKEVYLADYFGSAEICDVMTTRQVKVVEKKQNSWGLSGDISPDGTMMILGNSDGVTYLQSAESGEEMEKFYNNGTPYNDDTPIRGLSFAPDGKHFATVSDEMIRLWEIGKAEPIRTINGRQRTLIRLDATSIDHKMVHP